MIARRLAVRSVVALLAASLAGPGCGAGTPTRTYTNSAAARRPEQPNRGLGEAGTPRAMNPHLPPWSVNGTDASLVRDATERAIVTGTDPRFYRGRRRWEESDMVQSRL